MAEQIVYDDECPYCAKNGGEGAVEYFCLLQDDMLCDSSDHTSCSVYQIEMTGESSPGGLEEKIE